MYGRCISGRAVFVLLLVVFFPFKVGADGATQPTSGTSSRPAGQAKQRMLVLDLQALNENAEVAKVLSGLLTESVARYEEFETVSSQDISALVSLEAEKQSMQCDDNSCLGEIAGALGTRYVVFGSVGKLADLTVLQLNLFDADKAVSVGRQSIKGKDLAALSDEVDPAVAQLLAPLAPNAPVAAAQPKTGASAAESNEDLNWPMLIAGGATAAVGVIGIVTMGGVAFGLEQVAAEPDNAPQDKEDAIQNGRLALGGAAVCTIITAAGAAIAALVLVL